MSDNGLILQVENLVKYFPVTAGMFGRVVANVQAVDGVSFDIGKGETLGLVGESGCGKTTAGRTLLRLIEPTAGRIVFDGTDITGLSPRALRPYRRDMQIIFQDPFSSLNPRMTVRDIVGEALAVHGVARGRALQQRVLQLMDKVGLPGAWVHRYPHEFSGGQRQRIGIARAIALDPKFIVCDEPVSALDVSIQAQVINLLIDLRNEMGLSYLFIAHDLAVVKHISNRIAVMYLGQIVETARSATLFAEAAHPYTLALLSAIPVPDPERQRQRIVLEGDVPTPLHPPAGCRFHTRCPAAMEICHLEEPRAVELGGGHWAKCVHCYDCGAPGEGWRERAMKRMDEAIAANRARTRNAAPEAAPPPTASTASLSLPSPSSLTPPTVPGTPPAKTRRRIEDESTFLRAVGWGGLALGAALMLLGNLATGFLIALAAFGFLLLPSARDKAAAAIIALFVILPSLVGGAEWIKYSKVREARTELARLGEQIDQAQQTTGELPPTLDSLGWRLHEVFRDGNPLDPWGNAFLYRVPGSQGRAYDLLSSGPDGKPGTTDDVGFPFSE